MKIFRYDRDEWRTAQHGSVGLHVTRVAAGEGPVRVTHLRVEPGGVIGAHPAAGPQMFLVVTGDGWVAGPDGERVPVGAGDGVTWEPGEEHTSGTDGGLTALVVEGTPLTLFDPRERLAGS